MIIKISLAITRGKTALCKCDYCGEKTTIFSHDLGNYHYYTRTCKECLLKIVKKMDVFEEKR